MSLTVHLVGILNVTPDSFSDGGKYLSVESALSYAQRLVDDGADIVELGADSTRPGSKCVGVQGEWDRLSKIIEPLVRLVPVSIDTHHAEVARRAIDLGATMVNDVSAGEDPQMFGVVAASDARIILMYSRCSKPHVFDLDRPSDLIQGMNSFLNSRRAKALGAGIQQDHVILDPGFGAFISPDPGASWELVERFGELSNLNSDLMIACSRKGFLKAADESSIDQRDALSASVALRILSNLEYFGSVFIRAHNVAIHRQALDMFSFE